MEGYGQRWPCEVDHFYLQVPVGVADDQRQKLAGILRWPAVGLLTLAYLQGRPVQVLAQPQPAERPSVADIIAAQRHEQAGALIQAVAE